MVDEKQSQNASFKQSDQILDQFKEGLEQDRIEAAKKLQDQLRGMNRLSEVDTKAFNDYQNNFAKDTPKPESFWTRLSKAVSSLWNGVKSLLQSFGANHNKQTILKKHQEKVAAWNERLNDILKDQDLTVEEKKALLVEHMPIANSLKEKWNDALKELCNQAEKPDKTQDLGVGNKQTNLEKQIANLSPEEQKKLKDNFNNFFGNRASKLTTAQVYEKQMKQENATNQNPQQNDQQTVESEKKQDGERPKFGKKTIEYVRSLKKPLPPLQHVDSEVKLNSQGSTTTSRKDSFESFDGSDGNSPKFQSLNNSPAGSRKNSGHEL